jgi:hypothetical protein
MDERKKLGMMAVNMSESDEGNCEDTETERHDMNGEQNETGEAEYRLVTSRRKLTQ